MILTISPCLKFEFPYGNLKLLLYLFNKLFHSCLKLLFLQLNLDALSHFISIPVHNILIGQFRKNIFLFLNPFIKNVDGPTYKNIYQSAKLSLEGTLSLIAEPGMT